MTPDHMSHLSVPCSGAVQTALDSNAKAIVCITASGRGPAFVSKYRWEARPDQLLVAAACQHIWAVDPTMIFKWYDCSLLSQLLDMVFAILWYSPAYRPPVPVIVVTSDPQLVRHCRYVHHACAVSGQP
jgi:hypothetical protein